MLLLDKVLTGPGNRQVRGVELFNLNLARDLAQLGHPVSVPIHPDWHPAIERIAGDGATPIEPLPLPASCGGARQIGRATRGRHFPVLLLGNVANRLIPTLGLLRLRRTAQRCVLIAHREPSRRSLLAQKLWPSVIVAVNRQIAGHFERAGFRHVHVYYGVTDADRFHPPDTPEADDNCTHFCVTGNLDNAWKGADTAVAAFRLLPEAIRRRCRLHLAAFRQPPDFGDATIIAYDWMDSAAMPDFFRRMDVMIVPSRDEQVMRETFSQVMVQGMLSGLPILASRLPILEEKLDAGGGIVFDDPRALAEAMAQLADNPDRRAGMGRQARDTALGRYVWDTATFVERFVRMA